MPQDLFRTGQGKVWAARWEALFTFNPMVLSVCLPGCKLIFALSESKAKTRCRSIMTKMFFGPGPLENQRRRWEAAAELLLRLMWMLFPPRSDQLWLFICVLQLLLPSNSLHSPLNLLSGFYLFSCSLKSQLVRQFDRRWLSWIVLWL